MHCVLIDQSVLVLSLTGRKLWGTVPCEPLPWERWTQWLCYREACISLGWLAATPIKPVMSCLASSHFWTVQVSCNFPLVYYQQVQRLKCLWLCFSADVFFSPRAYRVSLAQLLSGSFLQHLLHPISCAVPYGNSYAGSPFRCLLRNSQAPVKATQNPSIRYLSDCIMDIMDHICISYHWIVLSTANFGCRFSQEQMSFSMACAALTSPLVPHGNWEADTIFSAGYSDCQFFLETV